MQRRRWIWASRVRRKPRWTDPMATHGYTKPLVSPWKANFRMILGYFQPPNLLNMPFKISTIWFLNERYSKPYHFCRSYSHGKHMHFPSSALAIDGGTWLMFGPLSWGNTRFSKMIPSNQLHNTTFSSNVERTRKSGYLSYNSYNVQVRKHIGKQHGCTIEPIVWTATSD